MSGRLAAYRPWGVASENRPQRGQFCRIRRRKSPAMGQEGGEKRTAAVTLQPTIPKPDRLLIAALALLWACVFGVVAQPAGVLTPREHQRGAEQTYLTFPEWYLVHSPAEYAVFVRDHRPDDFPFWGHIGQFWSSYRAVTAASRDYPFNGGYHAMIMVIGTSTTVEYMLRSAYETLAGRLSGLTQTHGMSAEDRLGAKVAQDYVDFIRALPWYEFDFVAPLKTLWFGTDWFGPDLLRKWERRYALTTEYGVKAAYAGLIKLATRAAFDEAPLVTAVVLDRLPAGIETELRELQVLQRYPDGAVLALVPRYEAFKVVAANLAAAGVKFREIAGNRGAILVSALVPQAWQPGAGASVLFTQPVITRPGEQRVALVTTVAALADALGRFNVPGAVLEHVYDY